MYKPDGINCKLPNCGNSAEYTVMAVIGGSASTRVDESKVCPVHSVALVATFIATMGNTDSITVMRLQQ